MYRVRTSAVPDDFPTTIDALIEQSLWLLEEGLAPVAQQGSACTEAITARVRAFAAVQPHTQGRDDLRVLIVSRAIEAFMREAVRRRVADIYRRSGVLKEAFVALFGSDLSVPLISERYPLRRVLLLGPTGSGKEGLAQMMGAALSVLSERAQPMQSVSAAAYSEELLKSELFGHEMGAFTGATKARDGLLGTVADRGTLLLDELDKTSPQLQSSLLRVLETHDYRKLGADHSESTEFHLIAAASMASREVASSTVFRRDLVHRLAGAVVELPSLASLLPEEERARREVFAVLVRGRLNKHYKGHPIADSDKTMAREIEKHTRGYAWPGNLRQLANLIGQAAIEGVSRIPALCDQMRTIFPGEIAPGQHPQPGSVKDELLRVERSMYAAAAAHADTIQELAEALDVTRQTAARRLRYFDLELSGEAAGG